MTALPIFRQVPAFYGTPVARSNTNVGLRVTATTPPPAAAIPGSPLTSIDSDGESTSDGGEDGNSVLSVEWPSLPAGSRGIPKPPGEVGKSEGRGYGLALVLHWPESTYKRFLKDIQTLAKQYLDTTRGVRLQDRDAVAEVVKKAQLAYPILSEYEGAWPVHDALLARLKTTSQKYRAEQRRLADVDPGRHTKTVKKAGAKVPKKSAL